jgi:myo-inositol catabolism protein IolC
MNERIRLLAEQAGFIDFIVFNRIESKEQVIEKFAQLIVKECADFIDSHKRVDEYGLACDIIYGVDLMKHFGVEE